MAGYILAFDYGLKRIGIAIGNSLTETASPLQTLVQSVNGLNWKQVDQLIQEWEPDNLLLGLPQAETESAATLCKKIKKFGQQLQTRYDLPLFYIDEQYTSVAAETELKNARQSGQRKRIQKSEIDQQAAAIILRQWFNEQQQNR